METNNTDHHAAALTLHSLKQLSIETRELTPDPVDTLHAPVNPCTFLRQHVATNTPVLIKGALEHWPACERWSRPYLDSECGDTEMSVELTPNGYGDAVTHYVHGDSGQQRECFCMPLSSRMAFRQFSDQFFTSKDPSQQQTQHQDIPYLSVGAGAAQWCAAANVDACNVCAHPTRLLSFTHPAHRKQTLRKQQPQQQNSNLTKELPQLLDDVEPQLDFAAAAFGAPPDAVNIWIGDERASTTFHKDHVSCLLVGQLQLEQSCGTHVHTNSTSHLLAANNGHTDVECTHLCCFCCCPCVCSTRTCTACCVAQRSSTCCHPMRCTACT